MEISLKNIASWFTSLRIILSVLGVSVPVALTYIEDTASQYIYSNPLLAIFFMFVMMLFLHFLQNKDIKNLKKEVQCHMENAEKNRLKGQVKQLAKELEDVPEITFEHTINYIYDCEERRVALGLNSFTEATLQDLISRIKG